MADNILNLSLKYLPAMGTLDSDNLVVSPIITLNVMFTQVAIFHLLGNILDENKITLGVYNDYTEDIYIMFQKKYGLKVTGKMTKETWDKLISLIDADKIFNILIDNGLFENVVEALEFIYPPLSSNDTSLGTNGYGDIGNFNYGEHYSEYFEDLYYSGLTNDHSYDDSSMDHSDGYYVNMPNDSLEFNENNSGESYEDDDLNNYTSGGPSGGGSVGNYTGSGGETYDDLENNAIVDGEETYSNLEINYNLDGSEYYYQDDLDTYVYGSAYRDYDYIYSLLANSVYHDTVINRTPNSTSKSTISNIGVYSGNHKESTNEKFFKSSFDIEIVLGAKGKQSRKILQVSPMSVTQQIDASGEPIYDLYEFVARDVVDGKYK